VTWRPPSRSSGRSIARARATLLALGALLVLSAGTAVPALAKGAPQLERGRQEIGKSRALIAESLAAFKSGDRERAYRLARTAYLDHFEYVEIPLRLRDPNLVLDAEFAFAELRNGIRGGASLDEVRASVRKVRSYLLDVDRELASKGVAAPALAFGFSFSILFREGLEAVLLITILLGSLAAGAASNYKRPLGYGVLAALAATAITWILANLVIDIAPVNRELLEAITALVAISMLVLVSFWLVSRLEQKRRMEFMRARVAAAMTTGSTLAFAGLGFTAVYREGFETVLFYQALALFAEGLGLWVALGAITAALGLAVVGYAILVMGKRLPLRPMLIAGASILLLLSVAFAGNAVRSLQEADAVGVTPVQAGLARLPVFVAELTGIHPTREGLLVQAAMLVVFAIGAAYVFAWLPARRRAVEARTA
jgi:high-affinity iron transporter